VPAILRLQAPVSGLSNDLQTGKNMNKTLWLVGLVSLSASLAACVTLPEAAPGADQVRETTAPADVQSCKAVGNIDPRSYRDSDVLLRNQVIGLGGDTALMTPTIWGTTLGGPGIAYRCAKD
jgi:hypothetical protein